LVPPGERPTASAEREKLLRQRSDVTRALSRLFVRVPAKSGSVIFVSGRAGKAARSGDRGYGFIGHFEEQEELTRRLRRLGERDRLLLFLWYVEEWAVSEIAERLGISRVHCYRLRDRALDKLTEPGGTSEG
jgi:RNA polymerase sigma factor (sigma-70 family)